MTATSTSTLPTSDPDLPARHAKLLTDPSIQFHHKKFEPTEPPAWIEDFLKFLTTLGPFFQIVFWIAIGLVVLMILIFLVREIAGRSWFKKRQKENTDSLQPVWHPSAADANDLLAAADELAEQGRYEEAAHLILLRSIIDIQKRWPSAIQPSLTARDIGKLSQLPDTARPAFVRIAQAVEASLFAGQALDRLRYASCRAAYADFALPTGLGA